MTFSRFLSGYQDNMILSLILKKYPCQLILSHVGWHGKLQRFQQQFQASKSDGVHGEAMHSIRIKIIIIKKCLKF
jgi:hypothetical protein